MFKTFALMQGFCFWAVILGFSLVQGDRMHPRRSEPGPRGILNPKTGQVKPFEDKEHWFKDAQLVLGNKLDEELREIKSVAKNVVFFLGDGMSVGTVTAARILKGQMEGSELGGEEAQLHFNTFPHIGVSRTFCTDAQTADSACSATAYLCGTKANDGTMGLTPTVFKGDNCTLQHVPANQVSSVLAWAQAAGKATGIVTTTRITHASPGGTYAHIAHRDWESDFIMDRDKQDTAACDDIAEQLILREPGRNIDVILGGGRREFTPNTTSDIENPTLRGRRLDGKNLIDEWRQANGAAPGGKARYITFRDELLAAEADAGNVDKLLGLFEYDHIRYKDEQATNRDPSLEEMTQTAIKILSRNPNGFFLFVEGGRIDHAHHDTFGKRALVETIEFDKAIERADDMTDDSDTLILVTSDHSHTMTMAGYPRRGNPILGIAELADDHLPYSTIGYANGPGYKPNYPNQSRYDISDDPFEDNTYRYITTAPIDSETHGGDDVLIFSKGPFAHLLTGVQQQSYIPHVVGYAACIGEGRRFEGCATESTTEPTIESTTGGQQDSASQLVQGVGGGVTVAVALFALVLSRTL